MQIDFNKQNKFKNLYLFFGEEQFLKDKYERDFIKKTVDNQYKMMNLTILENKDATVLKIKEVAETLPFMNEYRLLILKNTNFFWDIKDTEELLKYFKAIPKSTIILFIEGNLDKRLKVFKEIKKYGEVFELSALNETQLAKWLLDIFTKHSKKISMQNISYLIAIVGTDMDTLFNETNKLISYKKEDEITKEDIDSICTKNEETKVFELISFMFNKKLENALYIYKNLIFNKTSPFLILTMIARQFRIMLQIKFLLQKGYNTNDIADELKVRAFVVKEVLRYIKNFSGQTILKAIDECLEIDNKIKIGILQDELAIEMLIIKYSS